MTKLTDRQKVNGDKVMVDKITKAINASLECMGSNCVEINRRLIINTAHAVLVNAGDHVLFHHVESAVNEVCRAYKVELV